MTSIIVSGAFDDIRSREVRFLHEASKLGPVHLLLWSDDDIRRIEGKNPIFSEVERLYLMKAIRFVDKVTLSAGNTAPDSLPEGLDPKPAVWAVDARHDTPMKKTCCNMEGLEYKVIGDSDIQGFPALPAPAPTGKKKVVATGCFDWFHTGHVRFFEELSELGEVTIVVGNDANLKLLKGEGHPMFQEDERRYMVQSIRFVHQAWISSGSGWMDAEPEIDALKPDIYAVNEDGDKPEKRAFCEEHGLEYAVLKRTPAEGLPRRESTHLRGY